MSLMKSDSDEMAMQRYATLRGLLEFLPPFMVPGTVVIIHQSLGNINGIKLMNITTQSPNHPGGRWYQHREGAKARV